MTGNSDGGKDAERLDTLNKIYLTIISRYKDYIEEKEGLSVAELPTLVTPKNMVVAKKVEEIESGLGHYRYDADFYDASVMAFNFVKDEVGDAVLPLQFWLTPEETLAFLMGDAFDKNVLLCSLIIGLGNPSCKVFTTIKDDSRRIFVYYEFSGAVHMLDLKDGIKSFSDKDSMLVSLGMDEDTVAYEFNDRSYSDIR